MRKQVVRHLRIDGRLVKTRLYNIWGKMKSRCYYNPKNGYNKDYESYGGLGVRVCREWKNNFDNFFYWSMENGYDSDLSLDRKDPTGNYKPDNCKWSDKWEQANNKRSSIRITYKGVTESLSWWSRKYKINRHTLYDRLYRSVREWTVEEALTEKVR